MRFALVFVRARSGFCKSHRFLKSADRDGIQRLARSERWPAVRRWVVPNMRPR